VYLKDLVTVYEPARTLRSENAMLVVQPKVPTKTYGEREVAYIELYSKQEASVNP
jgi:hypothetical protein